MDHTSIFLWLHNSWKRIHIFQKHCSFNKVANYANLEFCVKTMQVCGSYGNEFPFIYWFCQQIEQAKQGHPAKCMKNKQGEEQQKKGEKIKKKEKSNGIVP